MGARHLAAGTLDGKRLEGSRAPGSSLSGVGQGPQGNLYLSGPTDLEKCCNGGRRFQAVSGFQLRFSREPEDGTRLLPQASPLISCQYIRTTVRVP